MYLIIDGYNLLGVRGFLGPGIKGAIETFRESLIHDLSLYSQKKGHSITVVFDAWKIRGGCESQENRIGIQIIFTREGEKADAVIQRLIRDGDKSSAVITSDQEIIRTAQTYGSLVMTSGEFHTKLSEALHSGKHLQGKRLMGQEFNEKSEGEIESVRKNKKGNPRKLPKALRTRQRRLKGF
jgi:predicted RNA-binding protein with PIN domain